MSFSNPDMGRCPFTGLPVRTRPEWTNVPISPTTKVSFRLVGEYFLDVVTVGPRTIATQKPYQHIREQVVAEAFGESPYVELHDVSQITGLPSSDVRKSHSLYQLSTAYQRCVGCYIYNASVIFRAVFRTGLALAGHQLHYQMKVVATYERAMALAVDILEQSQIKASGFHTNHSPAKASSVMVQQSDLDTMIRWLGNVAWEEKDLGPVEPFSEENPLHPLWNAFLLVQHDYSESLRKAQEAAQAKNRFLSTLSHEIRTPLNGLLGATELLAMELAPDERIDMLRILKESGDRLLDMVEGMLTYTQMESASQRLHWQPWDKIAWSESLRTRWTAPALAKGLTFIVNGVQAIPDGLKADLGKLDTLLDALIENAIKFSNEGVVEVHIEPWAGEGDFQWMRFTVCDMGPGIPIEKQAMIFEPFTQVDNSASRRHEGAGMGLAMAYRLAQALGGEIHLESPVNVNVPQQRSGCCFWVSLPFPSKAK